LNPLFSESTFSQFETQRERKKKNLLMASVRVAVRFRPNGGDNNIPSIVVFHPDKKTIQLEGIEPTGCGAATYTFDRSFSPSSTQADVFDELGQPVIEDVLKGYNGTILAYGQTGAGKTHTMFGAGNRPHLDSGLIPRSVQYLFRRLNDSDDVEEVTIKCQFFEIYKESIRDLLSFNGATLRMRETSSGDVFIESLSQEYCTSVEEVLSLIQKGQENRTTCTTDMNPTSSRSHSLFILMVSQKMCDGTIRTSKLNLADLAGSERISTSFLGKKGMSPPQAQLEETKNINKSLSALGNCIYALTNNKRTHIPYRESTLTFCLKDSLGGNTKTALIVNCSSDPENIQETYSSLKFAKRSKKIKNKASLNQRYSPSQLEEVIGKLQTQLHKSQQHSENLKRVVDKLKSENASLVEKQNSSPEPQALPLAEPSTPRGTFHESYLKAMESLKSANTQIAVLQEAKEGNKVKYCKLLAACEVENAQLRVEKETLLIRFRAYEAMLNNITSSINARRDASIPEKTSSEQKFLNDLILKNKRLDSQMLEMNSTWNSYLQKVGYKPNMHQFDLKPGSNGALFLKRSPFFTTISTQFQELSDLDVPDVSLKSPENTHSNRQSQDEEYNDNPSQERQNEKQEQSVKEGEQPAELEQQNQNLPHAEEHSNKPQVNQTSENMICDQSLADLNDTVPEFNGSLLLSSDETNVTAPSDRAPPQKTILSTSQALVVPSLEPLDVSNVNSNIPTPRPSSPSGDSEGDLLNKSADSMVLLSSSVASNVSVFSNSAHPEANPNTPSLPKFEVEDSPGEDVENVMPVAKVNEKPQGIQTFKSQGSSGNASRHGYLFYSHDPNYPETTVVPVVKRVLFFLRVRGLEFYDLNNHSASRSIKRTIPLVRASISNLSEHRQVMNEGTDEAEELIMRYGFMLLIDGERHCFFAESDDTRQAWINDIQKVVTDCNHSDKSRQILQNTKFLNNPQCEYNNVVLTKPMYKAHEHGISMSPLTMSDESRRLFKQSASTNRLSIPSRVRCCST